MTPPLPVYRDICNQAHALEMALTHHAGPGRTALANAAAALRPARRMERPIVVIAIGASFSAVLPMVTRLAMAGTRVILEDAAEFAHYTHAAYRSPSVFLLVSRSGSTIEITRSLERLQGRGHRVIGMTNVPDSPLAVGADQVVLFGGPNDDLIAIQTYLTTLLAMDLLAERTIGRQISPNDPDLPIQGDEPDAFSIYTGLVKAVQETVDVYRGASEAWRTEIRPFQAAYLLGRGASMASAGEGALLFHEMARFPAIPIEAGAFRHGMWEVVDERLRCFVFAPGDGTYDLNVRLAYDLAKLGAHTSLITSRLPEDLPAKLDVWQIPDIPPTLTPYLEVIPLQLFTYQLALQQGLTPGVFRTSAPVILTETGSWRDSPKAGDV